MRRPVLRLSLTKSMLHTSLTVLASCSGKWSKAAYPPPPYIYPAGLGTPDQTSNLTEALLKARFSDEDVLKIMGGNWVRVYTQVWGK